MPRATSSSDHARDWSAAPESISRLISAMRMNGTTAQSDATATIALARVRRIFTGPRA